MREKREKMRSALREGKREKERQRATARERDRGGEQEGGEGGTERESGVSVSENLISSLDFIGERDSGRDRKQKNNTDGKGKLKPAMR